MNGVVVLEIVLMVLGVICLLVAFSKRMAAKYSFEWLGWAFIAVAFFLQVIA